MEEISEAIRCAEDIEEMTKPLLEGLRGGIFRRRARMTMGPSVRTQKLMENHDSNDKNKENNVGAI